MLDFILRDSRRPEMIDHPSTQGTALMMRGLAEIMNPAKILDLGCGSGLLALAAAEFWPEARIIAADISPKAVEDAAHNIRHHGLEARITPVRSEGYAHPLIAKTAPYGLVLCNLLAEWQVAYATDLYRYLEKGGYAILSGTLAWKQPQVIQAHEALGFEIKEEIAVNQWHVLVLQKI